MEPQHAGADSKSASQCVPARSSGGIALHAMWVGRAFGGSSSTAGGKRLVARARRTLDAIERDVVGRGDGALGRHLGAGELFQGCRAGAVRGRRPQSLQPAVLAGKIFEHAFRSGDVEDRLNSRIAKTGIIGGMTGGEQLLEASDTALRLLRCSPRPRLRKPARDRVRDSVWPFRVPPRARKSPAHPAGFVTPSACASASEVAPTPAQAPPARLR